MTSNNLGAGLQQAVAALQAGRTGHGEAILKQILAKMPKQPDALQLLGLTRKAQGRLDEAVTLMRQSLEANPQQPAVLNNLGNVLKSQDKFADAISAYQQALSVQPQYVDAWINLGITQAATDRHENAIDAFDQALKLSAQNSKALNAKALSLRALRKDAAAEDVLSHALKVEPASITALHNRANLLRDRGRASEAVIDMEKAVHLAPRKPELYYGLGCALFDAGAFERAEKALLTALSAEPEKTEIHKTLRQLYFVTGRAENAALSYERVLARGSANAQLWADYLKTLVQLNQLDKAQNAATQSLHRLGNLPILLHAKADILFRQERLVEAHDLLAKAVEQDSDPPAQMVAHYARLLMLLADFDAADFQLDRILKKDPDDQLAWAYRELGWRMSGDDRANWLVDYETLVHPADVPVPAGFSDAAEFNAALAEELVKMHTSKVQPIDQTLRGGTQTFGRLFAIDHPLIQGLKAGIETVIRDFAETLADDPQHPFLRRKSAQVRFSGSWSCRLSSAGFHTNHMHPEGWISSAYYVTLPEAVVDQATDQGALRFGIPDLPFDPPVPPVRTVTPKVGRLVLFPSYVWHGTVPFTADKPRLTVAFDAVPA